MCIRDSIGQCRGGAGKNPGRAPTRWTRGAWGAGCSTAGPASQTLCGTACVDTKTNASHCGGCGKPCGGGMTCKDGGCECPSGKKDCGNGTCVACCGDGDCGNGDKCCTGTCKKSC